MNDPTDVTQYDDFTASGGSFQQPDRTPRIEGNACLVVLRMANKAPGWVRREAGVPDRGHLTFRNLRDVVGFPVSPAVTDVPPDMAIDLVSNFPKSKLWRAWVGAWDLRPDCPPGSRSLVLTGPGWGTVVVHDGTPPNESHLRLIVPSGDVLALEPFRRWVSRVWAGVDPDAR